MPSAARSICCAASCREAAGSRSAARPSSRRPASSTVHLLRAIPRRATSCCRSRSPSRPCRSTRLMQMQDGIARAYNWIHVALLPPYVVRHLVMLTIVSAAYLLNFPDQRRNRGDGGRRGARAHRDRPDLRAQPQACARRRARAEGLRGQDLVLGLAADPHRRRLLSRCSPTSTSSCCSTSARPTTSRSITPPPRRWR